jgi:DNA polymerase-1
VHDELLLEVRSGSEGRIGEIVREAMEGVYPLDVPLVVDQKCGPNWRDVG